MLNATSVSVSFWPRVVPDEVKYPLRSAWRVPNQAHSEWMQVRLQGKGNVLSAILL